MCLAEERATENDLKKMLVPYVQIQTRKSVGQKNKDEMECQEMVSEDVEGQAGLPARATTSGNR